MSKELQFVTLLAIAIPKQSGLFLLTIHEQAFLTQAIVVTKNLPFEVFT